MASSDSNSDSMSDSEVNAEGSGGDTTETDSTGGGVTPSRVQKKPDSAPPKRRGRPPKVKTAAASNTPKKRGRPPKTDSVTKRPRGRPRKNPTETTPKRPVGRPRKNPSTQPKEPTPKKPRGRPPGRPRGRPRKQSSASAVTVKKESASTGQPKRRGRPPKNKEEPVVKKRRGRPPKSKPVVDEADMFSTTDSESSEASSYSEIEDDSEPEKPRQLRPRMGKTPPRQAKLKPTKYTANSSSSEQEDEEEEEESDVEVDSEESEDEGSSSSEEVPVSKRNGRGGRTKRLTKKQQESADLFLPYFPSERKMEKVLGHRYCKERELSEYLIKWKGYSYLHVEWKTLKDLQILDEKATSRVQKYHTKTYTEPDSETQDDEEFFSPEFTTVDHILAEHVLYSGDFSHRPFPEYAFEDTGEVTNKKTKGEEYVYKYYLIKWCLLSYTEMTWEPYCVFKKDKEFNSRVELFRKHNTIPSDEDEFPKVTEAVGHTLAGSDKKSNFKRMEDSHDYKGFKLRSYQVEGVNWLLWNWCRGQPGSLLGDEMGLGKTIQCLSMIDELSKQTLMPTLDDQYTLTRGPHLVVVPLSCVLQWQREFQTWTDQNVVIYHGCEESRSLIRKYHFHFRNGADSTQDSENLGAITTKEYYRFNVLVTTYEMAVRDSSILQKINWHCMVVDEAHRLKNKESKLFKELSKLKRECCILLTGTPIQNNMQELWTLMNFIVGESKKKKKKPGRPRKNSKVDNSTTNKDTEWFCSSMENQFMQEFGEMSKSSQVKKMHDLLRPFLLRRIKEDVEKALPPKVETIISVELTVDQKKLYRAIYDKNKAFLFRGGKASNGPSLMNVMMELRKCCNHPFLIRGIEDRMEAEDGLKEEKGKEDLLIRSSGKLLLLDKLLHKLESGGHRVLIFSQMVRMLDILEDYLRTKDLQFERLDGGITGADRQAAIDRFSRDGSKAFVMLLSTRAGGLGLNLSCADTVIIYDSDWNPQNDLQAQARSHRIGQTRAVKVFRLITRKTYEMSMFDRASIKLGLDKALLTTGGEATATSSAKSKLSSKEIDTILKHGAYAMLDKDGDKASANFEKLTIEEILDQESREIVLENKASSLVNSFSKAKFESEEGGVKVDIDDPEFWTKVAGFKKEDVVKQSSAQIKSGMLMQNIVQDQTRRRKGVSRMGMIEMDSDSDETGTKNKNGKVVVKEKKKRGRKKKKKIVVEKVLKRSWSDRGRDDVVDGLLCYGWGKWGLIRDKFRLSMYGDESRVRNFAYYLYVFAYESCTGKSEWDIALRQMATPLYLRCKEKIKSVPEEDSEQIVGCLHKSGFETRMTTLCTKLLERVELLHRVNSIYEKAKKAAFSEVTEKCIEDTKSIPNSTAAINEDALFNYRLTYKGGLCGMMLGLYQNPKSGENIWYIKDLAKGGILDKSGFCTKNDVIVRVNGTPTSGLSSLVELVDVLFSPYQHKTNKSNEDSESEYVVSTPDDDSEGEWEPDMRVIEFARCGSSYVSSDAESRINLQTTIEGFSLRIVSIHIKRTVLSSATDEQASRALVSVIGACRDTKPIRDFLMRQCLFSDERASKVVKRAGVLSDHNESAIVETKEDVKNENEEESQYTERIQDKDAWERLKTELISRKVFVNKKLRKVEYEKRTMFVRQSPQKCFFWNRQLDIHLVIGVARHGMWKPNTNKPGLSMEMIASDPALAFSRIIGYEKAKQLFQAKLDNEKLMEVEKNQRAKEARIKYMERKKTQDPNDTTPRRRGRRKLEDLPPEEQEQVLADLQSLTKPIDGPALHLPKLRIVERYMMALLIREYEKSSGTIPVKRRRHADGLTEAKRAKVATTPTKKQEDKSKDVLAKEEVSKEVKKESQLKPPEAPAPQNGSSGHPVGVVEQPKVEVVQKVRVSDVDDKVLGKIDNVLDDLITEAKK